MIHGVQIYKGIAIDKLKKYRLTDKDREEFPQLESCSSEEQSMIIEESDILVVASVIAEVEESILFYKIVENKLITFTDILICSENINNYTFINDFTLAYFDKLYIVIAADLNDILIYDPTIYNSLSPQILLSGHKDSIFSVIFFKNHIISIDFSGKIFKWDFEQKIILEQFSVVEPEFFGSSEEEIFVCEKDKLIILDQNLKEKFTLRYNKGNIRCVTGSTEYLIIGDKDGTIVIYNRMSGDEIISKNNLHGDVIKSLLIHNNKIYSGSLDGSVLILSMNLDLIETLQGRNENIPVISLDVNEGYCVIGGGGFGPPVIKVLN